MHKCSLLWLGLAMVSTSSVALASDTGDYSSAFGSELAPQTDIAVVAPASPEDAAAPLRDVGSFPLRVRRGEKVGLEWADAGQRNYVPKPVVRKFKAGGCTFSVSTGDLGVTRYEFREDTREVSVSTDPVLRFSTLEVSATQGLLVSINAELMVAPQAGSEQACKEKFAGRKVRFGKADMEMTQLALQSEGSPTPDVLADVYMEQREMPIYLTWDEEANRLELVGKGGLTASVQSPVYLVKPRAEGDYYLTVSPKLGIERAKQR